MPIWKFITKMKRNCNGVFIEKGMSVEVVTSTTSNSLTNPKGWDQIAAAFMSKYGIDLKKANNLQPGYLDAEMYK